MWPRRRGEVGNPTILATLQSRGDSAMAFVRGLMGPYMRPIPVGASVAMLFSLVVASSFRRGRAAPAGTQAPGRPPTPSRRKRKVGWCASTAAMHSLLGSAAQSCGRFLGVVALLLLLACPAGAPEGGAW